MSFFAYWSRRFANSRMPLAQSLDVGGLLHINAAHKLDFLDWIGEVRRRARVIPLRDGTVLARSLGRYTVFLDDSDVGFATHIMMDGLWEPWIARFLISKIKPGMVTVDVGANYGFYTLIMADLVGFNGCVHAFEPNPHVFRQLLRSISVNGFDRIVTSYREAVLDVDSGVRVLLVPSGEPKNGHVSAAAGRGEGDSVFDVSVCTLNQRLAACPRVDFVKVDAEGAEELIVRGMDDILVKHKPQLLLEFNRARGVDPMGMVARLNEVYGSGPLYVAHDGPLVSVTCEELNSERIGEDWMLFYSTLP